MTKFEAILENMKNAKGLILDVRNNGGGNPGTVNYIISCFTKKQIRYSYIPPSGRRNDFIVYPHQSVAYTKPVVTLINGATFSGGELFPEQMRQLPNVIIIGDTTGGGGGMTQRFELPSGKKMSIPVMYFTRLDGTMIEWNGVLPDILVEQTKHDKENGRDYQIEAAINFLTEQSGM